MNQDNSGFMSKLQNAGSAFNMTTVMYIVAAILFIVIAVFIYYQYVKPSLSPSLPVNPSPSVRQREQCPRAKVIST